jgi:cysteinyl-tRNA synthetase
MSKSRGNFYTVRDLTSRGAEAGAIRLALMATHYRSNADFTDQGLRDAGRTVERWRRVLEAGAGADAGAGPGAATASEHPVLRAFADALHDDLNIAGAVAAVNAWVGALGTPGPQEARLMRAMDAVLGVLERPRAASASTEIGVFVGGLVPEARVLDLLRQRAEARAARDFRRSDAIRDELLAMGYAIKDVAGGKVEVRRRP